MRVMPVIPKSAQMSPSHSGLAAPEAVGFYTRGLDFRFPKACSHFPLVALRLLSGLEGRFSWGAGCVGSPGVPCGPYLPPPVRLDFPASILCLRRFARLVPIVWVCLVLRCRVPGLLLLPPLRASPPSSLSPCASSRVPWLTFFQWRPSRLALLVAVVSVVACCVFRRSSSSPSSSPIAASAGVGVPGVLGGGGASPMVRCSRCLPCSHLQLPSPETAFYMKYHKEDRQKIQIYPRILRIAPPPIIQGFFPDAPLFLSNFGPIPSKLSEVSKYSRTSKELHLTFSKWTSLPKNYLPNVTKER